MLDVVGMVHVPLATVHVVLVSVVIPVGIPTINLVFVTSNDESIENGVVTVTVISE